MEALRLDGALTTLPGFLRVILASFSSRRSVVRVLAKTIFYRCNENLLRVKGDGAKKRPAEPRESCESRLKRDEPRVEEIERVQLKTER